MPGPGSCGSEVGYRPRLCKNSPLATVTERAAGTSSQVWMAAMSGLAPRIAITRFRL
jgi:hypothetical protein